MGLRTGMRQECGAKKEWLTILSQNRQPRRVPAARVCPFCSVLRSQHHAVGSTRPMQCLVDEWGAGTFPVS